MAAIDQDCELDFFGAADVAESVECGAGGAAAVEDIIDEDDDFVGDVGGNGGFVDFDSGLLVKVVAVHGDIHNAAGNLFVPDFADAIGQAAGEVDTAALDADDDDFLVGFVAFGDFGGHAFDGALNDGGC